MEAQTETSPQTTSNHQVAVLMVPFPSQGHLNQLLHLAHLITSYNIPVHYAGSHLHNHQARVRFTGWDPQTTQKIKFHDLPLSLPPYISPPPINPNPSTNFPAHLHPLFDATIHLRNPIFELLKSLSKTYQRVVVVHDRLMSSVVQDVKLVPNVEAYMLIPISAFCVFTTLWESLPEKPFPLDDGLDVLEYVPSLEGCLTPEVAKFLAEQDKFMDFQSGMLLNTCKAIEGKYLELLDRVLVHSKMKSFAIGPYNPVEIIHTTDIQRHECIQWLDKQELNSVIYVSFGSSTTMSNDQIIELGKGLERSGQKFIWVLRSADKADIFAEHENSQPELAEGYEERVKNKGMVMRNWAPQLEILAHPSIGGFMSHCGWNSCLESISMGVPIAAWPMHSDQPRNATLVTQVLRIGLLVRDWEDRAKLVTADTIEDVVRRVMTSKQGEEMRKRAVELGEDVRASVADGGVSRVEMNRFIAHITR